MEKLKAFRRHILNEGTFLWCLIPMMITGPMLF